MYKNKEVDFSILQPSREQSHRRGPHGDIDAFPSQL